MRFLIKKKILFKFSFSLPLPLHLLSLVYHYQLKIQFINHLEKPVEPTFTMTLHGTKEENQKITITL